MNLSDYGYTNETNINSRLLPARITAVYRGRYQLVCCNGTIYGKLKTKEYYQNYEIFPTVGDFVLIEKNNLGDSSIVKTMKRKTCFTRLDPNGNISQAVAANFDYIFIVMSLNKDFNIKKLQRYLTLAWQSGGHPVVILTKSDLISDCSKIKNQAAQIACGVNVIALSAKTGEGLELLSQYIKPKITIVFLGSSGVGKSSLLNALANENLMKTSSIREGDHQGRHTTTHRELIMLHNGAMIIDTPGMRELGMCNIQEGIKESFADIEQYFETCRFSDCSHQGEPDCGVKEAIANGKLSQKRWQDYLNLKSEEKYFNGKETYLRKKKQRLKNISKQIKKISKTGGY